MRIRLSKRELRELIGALATSVKRGCSMPSKYFNKKPVYDGMTFDSMAEAERYKLLLLREAAHEIVGWIYIEAAPTSVAAARQQRFPLRGYHGGKVSTYVADFVYKENATGTIVVEDYKGYKTDIYKLKKKLFEQTYCIPITEITRPRKKRAVA